MISNNKKGYNNKINYNNNIKYDNNNNKNDNNKNVNNNYYNKTTSVQLGCDIIVISLVIHKIPFVPIVHISIISLFLNFPLNSRYGLFS